MYKANDALDRTVAKPIARTYVRVIPAPVRIGISNVQSNLRSTTVMINNALQGKFGVAANDLARFVVNLTIGVGGLLDPATQMGLERNDEDFGQTLGIGAFLRGRSWSCRFWGHRVRGMRRPGLVDYFTGPTHYIRNNTVAWGLFGLFLVDTRAGLLSLDETLSKVYDPYAFIRDAYLQRRAYQISDGKVTEEPLVDPGADEATDSANPAPPPEPPKKP